MTGREHQPDSAEKPMEDTYRKKLELATWRYVVSTAPASIDLHVDSQRARFLAELVSETLAALAGFAQINHINVSTDSKGEDSFCADFPKSADLARLDSYLRSAADVSSVNAWLDLCVLQKKHEGPLQEFIMHDQAFLFIDNNISKHGERGLRHGIVDISFCIQTDIYSPFTYCDNRTLAELNGPRLASFLHRLEEGVKLSFLDVDPNGQGGAYDLVYRYGFTTPANDAFFRMLAHGST